MKSRIRARRDKQRELRRQQSIRRYRPSSPPSHFIQLSRRRLTIDPARSWFIVRTHARREREVERSLAEAGFATCLPAESEVVVRQGRSVERQVRPAAGYLFVGTEPDICGRTALWRWHDETLEAERRLSRIDPRRPFYRVFGPVRPAAVQRFLDAFSAPVAVLTDSSGEPVFVFPAGVAGLAPGEVAHVCRV